MVFFLAFLVASIFGAYVNPTTIFDCSKIKTPNNPNPNEIATTKQSCLDAGYCYWVNQGNTCHNDLCLEYIADDDFSADPPATCTGTDANGIGSVCKMYYLTGVPNCGAVNCPDDGATNLYCRESVATFEHIVIDLCFFVDFASRVVNNTANVSGSNCQSHTGPDNAGSYVGPTQAQDCSLISSLADVCTCLGTTWCKLHPGCTLNGAGNACVQDPCNVYTTCPQGCQAVANPSVNDQNVTNQANTICVSTGNSSYKANNESNRCFYSYRGFEEPNTNCLDIRACNKITQWNGCSQTKNSKDEDCTLQDIPSGYFPTNKYCSDGREIPTFGAASHVKITSVFVLLAVLALVIL